MINGKCIGNLKILKRKTSENGIIMRSKTTKRKAYLVTQKKIKLGLQLSEFRGNRQKKIIKNLLLLESQLKSKIDTDMTDGAGVKKMETGIQKGPTDTIG